MPILREARVVPVAGGFSGAGVWKLWNGGSCFAVRCWPSPGLEYARLSGLHRLLRHVSLLGLTEIAVPLSSATTTISAATTTNDVNELALSATEYVSSHGTTPIEITRAGDPNGDLRSAGSLVLCDGRWWQVEPWMPGVANFHEQPSSGRLSSVMSLLSRFHRAAQSFHPVNAERTWFATQTGRPTGLVERLAKFRGWQVLPHDWIALTERVRSEAGTVFPVLLETYKLVSSLCPRMISVIEPLTELTVPLQPCLRDVWHDHVLYTDDRVTGLIDPAACRTDHIAADLSRLLRSLVEDDRIAWRQALDVYQKYRPFELQEWRLLDAYDQSGIVLAGMTWLEWLLVEHRTFPDQAAVQKRLLLVLNRLRKLSLTLH